MLLDLLELLHDLSDHLAVTFKIGAEVCGDLIEHRSLGDKEALGCVVFFPLLLGLSLVV